MLYLPCIFIGYLLCPLKYRYPYITIVSLLFYLYSGLIPILLLIFSSLIAYIHIHFIQTLPLKKNIKIINSFVACIIIILPFLIIKYFFPAFGWIGQTFEVNFLNKLSNFTSSILLPAGISFYSFQILSSVFYKKTHKYKLSLLEYLGYVSFFPQLIAGPIVRIYNLVPQLRLLIKRRSEAKFMNDIIIGTQLITVGLLFKTFLSDVLRSFFYNINYNQLTFFDSIFIIFSKSSIIYADFWGYSTIAIGLALLFGIQLPRNFLQPYLCSNIQEFWRRWHVTLGQWFLDYIYKPLLRRNNYIFSVLAVFYLTGIWHGYGIRFILWGILHGISLIIFVKYIKGKNFFIFGTILTFFWVSLLWILFFYPLNEAFLIYSSLINFDFSSGISNANFAIKNWFYLIFVLLVIFGFNDDFLYVNSRFKFRLSFTKKNLYLKKTDKHKGYNYKKVFFKSHILILNTRNVLSNIFCKFLRSPLVMPLLLVISILFFSYSKTFIYFNF